MWRVCGDSLVSAEMRKTVFQIAVLKQVDFQTLPALKAHKWYRLDSIVNNSACFLICLFESVLWPVFSNSLQITLAVTCFRCTWFFTIYSSSQSLGSWAHVWRGCGISKLLFPYPANPSQSTHCIHAAVISATPGGFRNFCLAQVYFSCCGFCSWRVSWEWWVTSSQGRTFRTLKQVHALGLKDL